jgi:hypothetical protein
MRNRFRSILLFSARLVVGYPAAWLLALGSGHLLPDVPGTVRCRCQSLFDWLLCVPVRHAAAHLAPRNDAELTLICLTVTASTFILTLWLLTV